MCLSGVLALAAPDAFASSQAPARHDGRASGAGEVRFVSSSGRSDAEDRSCDTAAYSTIQSAVNAAPEGSTVVVCRGTYHEDVVVSRSLTLLGRDAVIEGSATANGMCDQLGPSGPGSAPCLAAITIKASRVAVAGFTVRGAIGEGILATGSLKGGSISDVTIEHNRVTGNDTGAFPPSPNSPYPQCSASGQIPGDCGEGIHLMGATHSRVVGNYVAGNVGGVLLTDEFGPTAYNLVAGNNITRNFADCGVTVPGHNPFALNAEGKREPNVAGDYRNVIRDNRITFNGLQGEGAGVLFANAGPGTASYDNLVEHNVIIGNELSGVTMHAHTLGPGQFEDLSGNRISGNLIGRNNVGSPVVGPGDSLDGPPITDPFTTGILVFSGTVRVTVTITHNHIYDDHFGIWFGKKHLIVGKVADNSFSNVDVPVFVHP